MISRLVVSFCSVALLLTGCSDPRLSKYELRAEATRSALLACFHDVDVVPLENSENCGFASREIADWYSAKVCDEKDTLRCRKLRESYDFSDSFYWRTVADSLFKYGRPTDERMIEAGLELDEQDLFYLYRWEDSLERLFRACLKEQAKLQESAFGTHGGARFQRAMSVTSRVLADGQICIERDFIVPELEK